METPISPSAVGDGNSAPASSRMKLKDILRGNESYYQKLGYPDAASYFEAREQDLLAQYSRTVTPLLWPILQKDNLTRFNRLVVAWSSLMGIRGFLFPEILSSMVAYNAVRCARAALEGRDPWRRRRSDPNDRHPYGYMPLHLAAEMFSVKMVKLLLRHGASANHRTEGEHVVDGLLPLHVAVENASMHKYLEDHWADGHPLDNLVSLLCLPEMKMYLDTTRLIAQHTHNIVDELWDYIDKKKVVQLAILLLASQKQLRGPINRSCGKANLNGFESIRRRTYETISGLHLQMIAMVNERKNGRALKKLKEKKEALLTADALVGIVEKTGQALEDYIQTCSEVHHEEVLEHVSSILNSNGIVSSGKGIAAADLKCYQYPWETSVDKSDLRDYAKEPPKGLAIKEVRDKFFPYWKSVLSARLPVKIVPPCEPSRKDIRSTEASRKDLQPPNKSIANLVSMSRPRLASNYECRRQLCALAFMSLKVLRRT